ncbi:MAG: LysM peptidoglycan-binding domain-containing protein [Chloroflexi bacterium]|nr:LysM peptidoglycan-binding domain-containing protein [Chloroflexota bacterium]MCC6892230.1 LysM peptidoglycan-binding domain-containing protein [Anaerolineae bacterium]
MRRWLPLPILFAGIIALSLLGLPLTFAQNSATPTPPAGQLIQIERNDTLVGLAARFGKPVACLQAANNLASTNFSLSALTVILIPDDCNGLLAINNEATPTPESAEGLFTPTFTPLPTNANAATATATLRVTATVTPAATGTAGPTAVPTLGGETTYTVVRGDRLARIAQSYGLTVACIAAANNIVNPDLIYVGQQLLITPNCTSSSGGGVVSDIPPSTGIDPQACQFDRNPGRVTSGDTYVVQYGDALDFIACDFGIELQCLKDSNPQLGGLSRLVPGQTLNINFSCPIWRDSTLPPLPTPAG